jgi:hypothetical protein
LENDYGCSFLLTSRLNQDCCFSGFEEGEAQAGFLDNPDPFNFKAAFKYVIVKNLLIPSKRGKCDY